MITQRRNFYAKLWQIPLLGLAIILSLFVTFTPAQDDDAILSVESSIVLLNAAVTDVSGRFAPGLTQKQFTVFEDGIEQPITFFQAEQTPFAAVILLDTSGSMESRVSMARGSAIKFIDGLRDEDSVAIYRFDSKVELVQDFSGGRYLNDAFFDLKADGMTVLNDAIFKAAEVLSDRREKRRAIIVLSDGEDTMSKKSSDKALKAAIAADATIYTIDMAPVESKGKPRLQSISALKNFAEKSGGTFVSTSGGPAMRDAFKRIVEELGSQYTIAYEPKTHKKDGKFHTIEVRVARPNLTIRTRKGYNSPKSK